MNALNRHYYAPATSSGSITVRADLVTQKIGLIGSSGPTYTNLVKTIANGHAPTGNEMAAVDAALTRIASRKGESAETWAEELGREFAASSD